jgi:phenylpropionate dioxygenase-like ring-hydroxylating dioxygenase large terminal subunit
MNIWNPAIFGYWFAAARSDHVNKKPLAITVLDRPIVLVRFGSGSISVFEDRCPHRQVPLSHGRMTSNGLECPYHGWTFGADGRCTSVPGMPSEECLPQIGARNMQVREIDGLVWVRLAAVGEDTPPKMIIDLPLNSRRFLWQTRWDANVLDAMENFLDPMHTHSVHPGLVRFNTQRRRTRVTISETADGFCVDYQGQSEQSGILYRIFESPRLSERAYFAGAGTAQIEYKYKNGSVIRITLHFTPESADRTHVFATLHVENRWAPAWAVRLFAWPLVKRVAAQDACILALQSKNMKHFPDSCNASTKLDFVRDYLENIWKQKKKLDILSGKKHIEFFL